MPAADINTDFYNALVASGYSNISTEFTEHTAAQIILLEGGGRAEYVSSEDGLGEYDIQRPRMQIQVRDAATATGKLAARNKALAIVTLLHRAEMANCVQVLWDGRAPQFWKDNNARPIYAIEFQVIRRPGLVG